MTAGLEIQIIAVLISAACALPGTFLVLQKRSMISDSITHTILLGIVLAFFLTRDLNSPLLIIGAALMGLVTVWLTESLAKTRLVSEDSAIGVVFPLLFSIAIILITRFAGSVHLDTDSILLGELAFAPFERMRVFGQDIGAKAIYSSALLLLLNTVFILILYKELKLASFDSLLAAALGFCPLLLHYAQMVLVSLTVVGAFQAVGSILVVAFMIGPPASAWLLTTRLHCMLLLSAGFGALSGIVGYQAAALLDVSIAGSMAITTGLLFLLSFLCAPQRGLIALSIRRKRQRHEFAMTTLLLHICNHQDTPQALQENGLDTIASHLHWEKARLKRAMTGLLRKDYIVIQEKLLRATPSGISAGQAAAESLCGNPKQTLNSSAQP